MSDWDAAKYHRISDPQLAWGRAVAERLSLAAGERILDLGCGTGRLTAELAQKPGITVVGLDRSDAMLQQARGQTGVRPGSDAGQTTGTPFYVRGDGAALPFIDAFDVIFSAATFHWIPDHDRLFHESVRRTETRRTGRGPMRRRPQPRPIVWTRPRADEFRGLRPLLFGMDRTSIISRTSPTPNDV